jgi:hypothetical protein
MWHYTNCISSDFEFGCQAVFPSGVPEHVIPKSAFKPLYELLLLLHQFSVRFCACVLLDHLYCLVPLSPVTP